MGKYLTLAKLYQQHSELINRLLPKYYLIKLHSQFRSKFMQELCNQEVLDPYLPKSNLAVNLWGIKFRHPLLNAAGVFKNGEGYELVAKQGAGGYIGGTSTYLPRLGNVISKVKHPFLSLNTLSVNSLGLPNHGDSVLSRSKFKKQDGCPIGWSIMQVDGSSLQQLIESAFMYHDNLSVDFLEINVSCPNVQHDSTSLEDLLSLVSHQFLSNRQRNFPVMIKLSNDIDLEDIPNIIKVLIKYKFDGVNLGNTSINYKKIKSYLKHSQGLFDYFTNTFGGGISGSVLKNNSLLLCKCAIDAVKSLSPSHEFHVIRTGGIDSFNDLIQSRVIGVSLNQWYTGYIHNYINFEHALYKNLDTNQ